MSKTQRAYSIQLRKEQMFHVFDLPVVKSLIRKVQIRDALFRYGPEVKYTQNAQGFFNSVSNSRLSSVSDNRTADAEGNIKASADIGPDISQL
jgi:hypothetical protein